MGAQAHCRCVREVRRPRTILSRSRLRRMVVASKKRETPANDRRIDVSVILAVAMRLECAVLDAGSGFWAHKQYLHIGHDHHVADLHRRMEHTASHHECAIDRSSHHTSLMGAARFSLMDPARAISVTHPHMAAPQILVLSTPRRLPGKSESPDVRTDTHEIEPRLRWAITAPPWRLDLQCRKLHLQSCLLRVQRVQPFERAFVLCRHAMKLYVRRGLCVVAQAT